MATQILQASDPRMQELKTKITNLASGQQPAATQMYAAAKTVVQKPAGSTKKDKTTAAKPAPPSGDLTQVSESAQNVPAAGFSATKVIGAGEKPGPRKDGTVPQRPSSAGKETGARKAEAPAPDATVIAGPAVRQAASLPSVPAAPRSSGTMAAAAAPLVAPAKPEAGNDALGKILPILTRPPV